jgi:hypothetical protein
MYFDQLAEMTFLNTGLGSINLRRKQRMRTEELNDFFLLIFEHSVKVK